MTGKKETDQLVLLRFIVARRKLLSSTTEAIFVGLNMNCQSQTVSLSPDDMKVGLRKNFNIALPKGESDSLIKNSQELNAKINVSSPSRLGEPVLLLTAFKYQLFINAHWVWYLKLSLDVLPKLPVLYWVVYSVVKTNIGHPSSSHWYYDFLLQGAHETLSGMDFSEKTLINQAVYYTTGNLDEIIIFKRNNFSFSLQATVEV